MKPQDIVALTILVCFAIGAAYNIGVDTGMARERKIQKRIESAQPDSEGK